MSLLIRPTIDAAMAALASALMTMAIYVWAFAYLLA